MTTQTETHVAINFLFPSLNETSEKYQKISEFIKKRCDDIGCAVLYYRNSNFTKLLNSLELEIGTNEVIVTGNSVRASRDYSSPSKILFEDGKRIRSNEEV